MSRGKRSALWRAGCALVLALSGLLYAHTLTGMLIWDDHVLVGGEGIGGGKTLIRCFTQPFLEHYYRPLVSASFFLDRRVWGVTPFGFHQTNILLHVLTTGALIGLLRTAFRRRSVALAGGLLFAVQPAQVSGVAWIGGRTDSLCALWVALFAWALILAARSTGRKRAGFTVAAVATYAGAILTKEQMLAILPLVPLAFWCFRPDNPEEGADSPPPGLHTLWWATLPFVVVSLLFVGLWALIGPPRPVVTPQGPGALLAQGGRTLTYFTLLLLAPMPQWMHTFCLGTLERAGAWPVIVGFAMLGLSLLLFRRWLRTQPAAAWFLGLVLLSLLPVSNFVPMPSLLVAPYRGIIAGLGVAALLGWGFGAQGLRGSGARRSFLHPFTLVGSLYAVWCVGLTLWGAAQWRDEKTIYSTIVRHDPYSIVVRLNLTSVLLQQGQTAQAVHHLETLLTHLFGSEAWRSRETAMRAFHADPRILARVRENQGNRVEPNGWLSAIFAQLGFGRLNSGDASGGRNAFETALDFSPEEYEAHLGMGYWAALSGQYRQAVRHLRRAIAVNSEKVEAHAKLGQVLATLGRWKEAREEFLLCVRDQPWTGQGHLGLAQAQWKLGDLDGAVATLEDALRRAPNREDVLKMLANIQRARSRRPL